MSQFIIKPTQPSPPYDVVVFIEGGHYIAEDRYGRTICSDSPTACIQEAINYVLNLGRGRVFIRRGDYYISPNAPNQTPGSNVYGFIGINANPNTYIEIFGEPGTILYAPQNNTGSTAALLQAWYSNPASNGYASPRIILRQLKIVNTNTSNYETMGFIYNGCSSIASSIGPIIKDVEMYNPNNSRFTGLYFGVTCGAPAGSYGVVVEGFRFFTLNSSGTDRAIGVDSVSHAMISNSFLYSSTVNGWYNTAFFLGSGEILLSNSYVLGFARAFHADATDGASSIHVDNSVIGLNRWGWQSLDNAANALVIGNNGDRILSLTSNASLRMLISNSRIEGGVYSIFYVDDSSSPYLDLEIVNSRIWGSLIIGGSTGTYYVRITDSRILTNNGDGVFVVGSKMNYLMLKDSIISAQKRTFSYADGNHAVIPVVAQYQVVEDNDVFIGGISQGSGYYAVLTQLGTTTPSYVVFRRNRFYLTNTSGNNTYYYALAYASGSSSSPTNYVNTLFEDNRILTGQLNALLVSSTTGATGYATNLFAHGNIGIPDTGVTTPSVPASGSSVTNSYQFPVEVYLSGGTVTQVTVTRRGTTYTVYSNSSGGALNNVVRLDPGDSITITYSSAPSWVWVPA